MMAVAYSRVTATTLSVARPHFCRQSSSITSVPYISWSDQPARSSFNFAHSLFSATPFSRHVPDFSPCPDPQTSTCSKLIITVFVRRMFHESRVTILSRCWKSRGLTMASKKTSKPRNAIVYAINHVSG